MEADRPLKNTEIIAKQRRERQEERRMMNIRNKEKLAKIQKSDLLVEHQLSVINFH